MKKLGIIGGMGSVAAAHVFRRLVELTPAHTDQEYIETIIHNNTRIPDRTQGILFGEESPLPELKRSVELLNNVGADYIIFACMTSHYFISKLQEFSKAKLIDGVEETAIHIKNQRPEINKIGLIASTGAIKISIFQKRFHSFGIKTITMDDENQEKYFTEPIYEDWGIKAGNTTGKPKERLLRAVAILVESGAEAIVAGCSELPLVLTQKDFSIPLIDSIDILAKAAINRCLSYSA